MNMNLYDPDINLRYKATCEYEVREEILTAKWERACWGSLNGWIMLIGPSPGKADSQNEKWSGGIDVERPKDETAVISSKAGVIDFNSNKARNKKWTNLILDFVDKVEYAEALTTVCNLDWGHNSSQSNIPLDYLRQGCTVVFDKIVQTKPRIVAAMTVSVWEILLDHFNNVCSPNTEAAYITPLALNTNLKRSPMIVKVRENDNAFLFMKLRHPSRPIPTKERHEYRKISGYIRNNEIDNPVIK